jgi:hypothetical protein
VSYRHFYNNAHTFCEQQFVYDPTSEFNHGHCDENGKSEEEVASDELKRIWKTLDSLCAKVDNAVRSNGRRSVSDFRGQSNQARFYAGHPAYSAGVGANVSSLSAVERQEGSRELLA